MNRGDTVRLTWADEPTIRTVVRAGANGTYLLDDGKGGTVWAHASMIATADAPHGSSQVARSGGEPTSSSLAPARPTSYATGVAPPAPVAYARITDPDASRQAAQRVNASFDAWLVLAAHIAAGEHGMTGDDFPKRTGRKYEQLGPRRPWLVNAGWVELTDAKRKAKGVYVAIAAGVAAWAAAPHDIRVAVEASLPAVAA